MYSRTTKRGLALTLLIIGVIFSTAWHNGGGTAIADPARFDGMPEPEAFAMPERRTADEAADAVAPTLGASTVKLRAGAYQLHRFGSRGKLLERRTIRLSRARVYATPRDESTFDGARYVKLASGTYSGWWVPAATVQPAGLVNFSSPMTVTVRAGDLVARRFFGSVITRLPAKLASATTYTATRRATFNNATHYLIADGPFAGRWIHSGRLLSTGINQVTAPTVTPAPTPAQAAPLTTWKSVVLLYRETDVTFRRADGSNYRLQARMSNAMYDLVRKTLLRTSSSMPTWAGGMAALDMKIIDMPHPLTQLDPLGSGYWVGPRAVAADLATYAPTGTYDSIFVMYQPTDAKGVSIPIGGWGLTIPQGSWSNGSGFSSVVTPHEMWWWTESPAPEEVFMHEWMHQVLFFHEAAGRINLDLHAGEQYGYKHTNGSWKTWLMDVMQGKVKDGDRMLGMSAAIWSAGKPTAK